MGTAQSRRMDDNDSRSVSDDPIATPDQESDLTTVLEFLVRSGQLHIISTDVDDTADDDYVAAASPTNIDYKPDTKLIEASEISILTKQASGLLHSKPKKRPSHILKLLNTRQEGMYGHTGFTTGDKCKISNDHFPSRMRRVAIYCNKAFCGTYSQDGERFLTACQDRLIRVYHSEGSSFKIENIIQARDVGWSILDTAFSPDGSCVAYSSWSASIHCCRLDGHTINQEALPLCPEDRRFCIFSLVFSSDGHEILGGANDGYLYVYDRQRNQRTLRIEGHYDDVNTVAFADDTSQIFYSGGDDGLCKVWDRRTLSESDPEPVGVLAGHMDGITFIDSRGDARHLISNSKDQSIKLWDIRRFSSHDAQENTRQAVSLQNWDYRWQKVPRKLINTKFNMEGDSSIMTYRGHVVLRTLIRCRFSPKFTTGQRYIYTGCASGKAVVYDALSGEIVKTYKGHQACVRDVAWHPYRPELITTSWDYSVKCWSHIGTEVKKSSRDSGDQSDSDSKPSQNPVRRSKRLAEQRKRNESQRSTTAC